MGQNPWAVEAVQRRLAQTGGEPLNHSDVWIIDETTFPKAGRHSVGVARQYCGTLGKVANCQVAVSLHWSSAEASYPLTWRLYPPKAWIDDPHRAAQVKLPPGTPYRREIDLALELIDQVRRWEVRAWPLVTNSFYGNDIGFRQARRPRQVAYVIEVEPSTSVWTENPHLPWPPRRQTGRPASTRGWRRCRDRGICRWWPTGCRRRPGNR